MQSTQRSVDPGSGADAIGNRISAVVVEKLDATHSMLQTKLDSILEGHTRSAADDTGDNNAQNPTAELENRMSQLEDKVDTILAELRGDGGKDEAGKGLEDRMSQLEEKMDMMVGEMRKFFSSSALQAPSAPSRERSSTPFDTEGEGDLDSFAPEVPRGYPRYNDNGDDGERYGNVQNGSGGDGGDNNDGDYYNQGDGENDNDGDY